MVREELHLQLLHDPGVQEVRWVRGVRGDRRWLQLSHKQMKTFHFFSLRHKKVYGAAGRYLNRILKGVPEAPEAREVQPVPFCRSQVHPVNLVPQEVPVDPTLIPLWVPA